MKNVVEAKTAIDRTRPIPDAMVPSATGLAAAERTAARAANILLQAIEDIAALGHPIERAVGATKLLEAMKIVTDEVKEVRRLAVKDAYEAGSSESGWYGYSALASQLGISASRVRQILFDISLDRQGNPEIRDEEALEIRETAAARRDAVKQLKRGVSQKDVAAETGLALSEVRTLAREIDRR